MKSLVFRLIRFVLGWLVIKRKNKVVFDSSPDYSDNARAFSDFLLSHSAYNLYWAVEHPERYYNTDRLSFFQRKGNFWNKIVYVYHTVTAKYLISTHGAFQFSNKKNQVYVCCWHGMPLKRIGLLQESNTSQFYLNQANFILSTSKYYVPIIAKCFGKEESEILPLGYPRNDWLYYDSDVLQKLGVELKHEEKMIMYLPTFRKGRDGKFIDSTKDMFNNTIIDFCTEESLLYWNALLHDLNIKLIVKPHPAESNQMSYIRFSNITIVPHYYFQDKDIQLNQVMHYADAIITDFSGAFCDYLNLDRPMAFMLADLEDYKNNRGFVFKNALDYMPGAKITNSEELKAFLVSVSKGDDSFAEQRRAVYPVFSDFRDANNCLRLAKYLNLKLHH